MEDLLLELEDVVAQTELQRLAQRRVGRHAQRRLELAVPGVVVRRCWRWLRGESKRCVNINMSQRLCSFHDYVDNKTVKVAVNYGKTDDYELGFSQVNKGRC